MNQEPIIKYEEILENFGDEMVALLIDNFERMTFYEKMNNLLCGIIERDWIKAMIAAHTMKGSSCYISARRFSDACKNFKEIIKEHVQPVDPKIREPNKYYELKDTFDEIQQLKAYDLFYLLLNEALLLKKEMSKNTNSECPEDIFQKECKLNNNEVQLIKNHHRELKARVKQHEKKLLNVNYNNTQLDPPVFGDQCCKKCVIF